MKYNSFTIHGCAAIVHSLVLADRGSQIFRWQSLLKNRYNNTNMLWLDQICKSNCDLTFPAKEISHELIAIIWLHKDICWSTDLFGVKSAILKIPQSDHEI